VFGTEKTREKGIEKEICRVSDRPLRRGKRFDGEDKTLTDPILHFVADISIS